MDLKIKDVAELFNVTELTIYRFLIEKKIPAYWIHEEYRFDRLEVEDWFLKEGRKKIKEEAFFYESQNFKERKSLLNQGRGQFILYRALNQGDVLDQIPGNTKEEVICHALKKISIKLNLDANGLSELFLQRERLYPTSLNHGVGVPHTRDFLLDGFRDMIIVVFPQTPIDYGALDGQPVHTLFFLFACEDKHHLHLLAKIAHFVSFFKTCPLLKTHPSKQKLLNYIKEWESA